MDAGETHVAAARMALTETGAKVQERQRGVLVATVTDVIPATAVARAGRGALRALRAVRASGGAARAGLAEDERLATRLCELALPDEALMMADDARLAESSLRLRVVTDRRIGEGDTVRELYVVAGVGPRRSPDEGIAPRLLSPFVGRERELAIFAAAVAQAREGRGGMIQVVGAPGIGKSRLVFEARRQMAGGRITYLEGRCAAYARGIPLLPVLDILRDDCGIDAGDPPAVVVTKVRRALEELELPLDEASPYLLRLFGVPEAARSLEGITPEAVRARTLRVLQEMALQGSRRRPLVLVVEDLHWADVTSERFFAGLLPSLPHHALLVVTTHRSGHNPPWTAQETVTHLHLDPLSAADATRILHRVVGGRSVEDGVFGAIVERAEGNPLYLEELGRSVRDSDRQREPLAAPASLEGLLRARLMRLPGEPRRLLEVASVIGRRVPRDLLLAVAEAGHDPGGAVDLLIRHEFIHRDGNPSEPVLVFDHALVQDAVLRSMPPLRRRGLHAAVARELAGRAAGRDDEIVHQLADHWSKAERPREALVHLCRSAELSARGYGHEEADRTLMRATAHAEGLPEGERDAALQDLAVRRARSLYFLGRVSESVALLRRLDGVGSEAEPGVLAELRFWLAHGVSHLGDPDGADRAARQSAALAERAGDTAVLGRARYLLAREGWWTGNWKDGIAEGEAAVALLEETGQSWWLGHCLCYIGHGHQSLGRFDQALASATRARAIGDASGDPRVRSFSAWSLGWYLASMGRTDEAVEACEEAIAVSPDPANSAWALGFLGFAHRERGEPARAIDELTRAIEDVRRAEHPRVLCWFEGWIADAYLAAGQPQAARAAARSAVTTARAVRCPWAAAYATRSLGRVALEEGAAAAAWPLLTEAASAYDTLGGVFERGVTLLDLARAARAVGDETAVAALADEAGRVLAPLPVPRWHRRANEAASPAPP